MGKSSKYPSYSGGNISINGENKASNYKKGNIVYTNYNMSDNEKRAYNYAQKSFADSIPKVNIFDEATRQDLQSQLDAYTTNGQKLINKMYKPVLEDLKTDIASRFGNFDNSVFMDNLKSIESNRSESMSDLAQDITAKRDELIGNELSKRYNYLNFLQDIQNKMNSNALNFIQSAKENSKSGNDYNAQAYQANRQSQSGLVNYMNLASGALSMMGPYRTAASGALQIGKKFL